MRLVLANFFPTCFQLAEALAQTSLSLTMAFASEDARPRLSLSSAALPSASTRQFSSRKILSPFCTNATERHGPFSKALQKIYRFSKSVTESQLRKDDMEEAESLQTESLR